LRTSGPVSSGLIEVYPHPALIELTSAKRRLPYKFAKRRKYWPAATAYERSLYIWREMRNITLLLENEIRGAVDALQSFQWDRASTREWKAYEDKLDAIVCAVVGICALEGRATRYGDDNSAIWIPNPGSAKPPQ
jgi:predicted RNase H-like nuclease